MQREYTTRKVKEDDVRKLFPVLAEQDARKEMDFLLSVCRSPWGIRGAMNLSVSYTHLMPAPSWSNVGLRMLKTIFPDCSRPTQSDDVRSERGDFFGSVIESIGGRCPYGG